jgi:hypothetical protein
VKRQTLGLLCGAVAALMAPAAAPAAPSHAAHASGPDADVRCLIFAMNMAASSDQGAKTVGFLGVAYYMGRLDSAGGHGDLEARMEAQITQMKGMNVSTIAQGCGQALSTRMKAVSVIGQQLQQKFAPAGQAQAPAPAQQQPLTLKPIPSPQSH